MNISGTHSIAAERATVWRALNDPEILRRSLPGCESVTSAGDGEFDVVLALQVGPLKARFNGKLQMTEMRPPQSCVLLFRGQGGAMGFAQGRAGVELEESGGQTTVSYTADAQIGGRLAQLGSRMIDAVARRSSDQFFTAFQQVVTQGELKAADAVVAPAVASTVRGSERAPHLVPAWWLFVAIAIGAAAALTGVLATT
jgi:carbon monoxide dehydrogenase subunit G